MTSCNALTSNPNIKVHKLLPTKLTPLPLSLEERIKGRLKLTSSTLKKGDKQRIHEKRGRQKVLGEQIVAPHTQSEDMEIEELEA
jgi:hypothetical protein